MKHLLAPAVLLTPALVAGQDLLSPLVVTGSRSVTELKDLPYTTTVLDQDFLEQNTRRTLPEALQYTPGVSVQKTANGAGSPFIRGFTGRQNLLLVDGVRINNSTFRSGPVQYWNTIDSQTIDHLELIKSQGSVLYGSDAIGGTLNAFTKSSDFRSEAEGQAYLGGSASYQYRTNGDGSHITRLETETGIGGQFGILLGISSKDFGDIEDSDVGLMRNTGYPEQDIDLRFDWAVTPDSTLTFASYYLNQDDVWRWHRTRFNPGWYEDGHLAAPGRWAANTNDQEHSLTFLRYAGENPVADAFIKRWSATLSWQRTDDSEFQNRLGDPAPGTRPIRGSNITTQTTGIDLTLESPVGPGTLVYGFDYYNDAVESSGYQRNLANTNNRESLPIADDSSYDLFGAFAQYVWKPIDKFELTGGTRYTYAQATLGRFYNATNVAQPSTTQDWDDLTGSFRGLYHLTDAWSLYGGISQAFRAPNLDDLSGNRTSLASTTGLGSVDVSPEQYLTYEIGTRHTTGKTSFNAAIFYTDVNDLIVGVPATLGSTTTVSTNNGNGFIYGAEFEGAWKIDDQWTLSGFAAWQEGRTTTSTFIGGPQIDKPNTRSLPLSGSVALRWTAPGKKVWVEGRVLAAATEDRITAADQAADNQRIPTGGTPGYFVTSLYSGWQATNNLELTCGLENLNGETYRAHGSGQNEPGFNAILGAKVIW